MRMYLKFCYIIAYGHENTNRDTHIMNYVCELNMHVSLVDVWLIQLG